MNQKSERRQRYAQKLRDPRWQKKRLKILERDLWSCQQCGDTESTLHVHHRRYSPGDPWDAPDEWLLTLCEECHAEETEQLPVALKSLCDVMRTRFMADEISFIAWRLEEAELPPNTAEAAIVGFLDSPDLIRAAEDRFLARARENREYFYAQASAPDNEEGDS